MFLSKELSIFVRDIINIYPFDLMFAVQRKGMANIKLCSDLRKFVGKRIFFLDSIEFARKSDIKGKRLLLYDDACETGASLANSIKRLKHKAPREVKSAALTIRKDTKQKPDFYRFSLNDNDFRLLLSSSYDVHFGDQLYDDHIYLKILTKQGNRQTLLKHLQTLGPIIQTSESPKVVSFTLLEVTSLLENICCKSAIQREGVEKIRFFFHNDGQITIVPRAYPAIKVNSLNHDECKTALNLCKHFGPRSEIKCVKCILFSINVQLLANLRPMFEEALSKSGYFIKAEDINAADLNAAFFFGADAIKAIRRGLGMRI